VPKCPRCGWKISTLDPAKVKGIQQDYPNAFSPWTREQDVQLQKLVKEGVSLVDMVETLGRQPSAIRKRITLLGLDVVKAKPKEPVNERDYLPREGVVQNQ